MVALSLVLAGCDIAQRAPEQAPAPKPAVTQTPTPEPKPIPPAHKTLSEAAEAGDLAGVKAFLANRADVSSLDAEQMTPLHHAALNGHTGIIRLLLEHKADIEARDAYGYTPLLSAVRNNHLPAVRELVEAGADTHATELEHLTAYDIARIMHAGEIEDYLALHGAAPVEQPPPPPPPAAPPPELLTNGAFRVWTSLSGEEVEAEFVSSEFDMVQLRKRDQNMLQIRLALLKPEDQALVRQLEGLVPPRLTRTNASRTNAADSLALRIGRDKEWTVLQDCKLIPRDGNDGDSFHVRHDGKEYIFRLYYVDCAETSLAYPDRVRDQAEYFHITEKEALDAGIAAEKFTEKLLSAEPFTVVTKWEDARGNSKLPREYAFVVTPQGDLDELLAAEGLVRVYGMKTEGNLGERKQETLKRLEQEARREGAGAWGIKKAAEARP